MVVYLDDILIMNGTIDGLKRDIELVTTLRQVASLIGNFSWAIAAVPFAQAHFRSLQSFQNYQRRLSDDRNTRVNLSAEARSDLEWWLVNLERVNGKIFFPNEPDL